MKSNLFAAVVSVTLFAGIQRLGLDSHKAERKVSGIVTSADESLPIEGVTVHSKASGAESGTQPDGIYYINVSSNDSVLSFQRDGFVAQEIKLTEAAEYNVQLQRSGQ